MGDVARQAGEDGAGVARHVGMLPRGRQKGKRPRLKGDASLF